MVMADCPYNKIAVMQLFYELKQKFPTIPDQVVTDYMHQASYNREECERRLLEEKQRFPSHCYPVDIVDKMTEGKERPKTLSLQNVPSSTDRCRRFSRFSNWLRPNAPPIDEQRESGYVSLPAAGCEKCIMNSENERVSDVCESVKNIEISLQKDDCGCERTSLRVRYKKNANGTSHSAPTTPSSFQNSIASDTSNARKHRSSLNVDRSVSSPCSERRPSTSILLTLRSPSTEPQPAINVSTKGSNLMYSTSSYNSKQGYQNQLQICISEEGNTTLSASRTKAPANIPCTVARNTVSDTCSNLEPHFEKPLSSATELRLQEQIERKNRLEQELIRDKLKLQQIRREVETLEEDLQNRKKVPLVSKEVLCLRAEVRALQIACNELINQIDAAEQPSNAFVPIAADSGNWTCLMCTFKNHPMLPKCEQCDMARVDLNSLIPNIVNLHASSPHPPAIHPHV